MKATELRIGNFYQCVGECGLYYKQVEAIKHNQFGFLSDFDNTNFENARAITITEQWLLKFGFYKNIDTQFFEKNGYQIDLSVIKCLFYFPSNGDWYKEIEYVHQLQNLWFSLTEEELIINH
jgi:hypothetical protein